jgi:hypothetical protein
MTASKGLDTSHHNWHPAVHSRHCDEELQFLLIRVRGPRHEPVTQQIRKFLDAAEIRFACEYTLFGYWDALVRVWLKHASTLRLIDAIENKEKYNIDDAQSFAVTKLYYLWHSDSDLLAQDQNVRRLIAQNSKHINAVTECPERPPAKDWNALVESDLVFRRPPTPPGGVKFYTALARTTGKLSAKAELKAIKRALDETRIPSSKIQMSARASLYAGTGERTAYMIRCVADTYEDVLAVAEQFDVLLLDTDLRPTTYPVANRDPRELDHPNEPRHAHLTADTAELLEMEDAGALGKLQSGDHAMVHELALHAHELAGADTDLLETLLSILRASVRNDKPGFGAALEYLRRAESLVRSRVQPLFAAVFGKTWIDSIASKCEARKTNLAHAKEMRRLPLRTWGLGMYLRTARIACKLDARFNGQMLVDFGPDWRQQTGNLHKMRNNYAHAEDLEEFPCLHEYTDQLVDFLRRAMKAASYLRRTELAIAQQRTKSESQRRTSRTGRRPGAPARSAR